MKMTIGMPLLGALILMPASLFAVLGDTAASVLNDQARMKGALRSTDHQAYVLHEITTSAGLVREYATPGGAVFAVAWEGPFMPDFQQLLGPYYQQANQAREQQQAVRRRRSPISIETPGLVVYQTGHARSFHGVAYVPQLVPTGVQPSDIR